MAHETTVPIHDDVEKNEWHIPVNQFQKKAGVNKPIKSFDSVKESTKNTTSIVYEIIYRFAKTVESVYSGTIFFEAELILRRVKMIEEAYFQNVLKYLRDNGGYRYPTVVFYVCMTPLLVFDERYDMTNLKLFWYVRVPEHHIE